ncbi:unnamed protein product [Protopolystoma xenopodis]|uniref:Uncharacterized protein n=1 Tax=Protopolystoma xenopodis TaxID=117903 RepID=A0A448XHA8_9PLAT|nr:unnamed protein product [Protopolystoma xenopodis]
MMAIFKQSSVIPLAKIATAPSRSLRLLWSVSTAVMVTGLVVCISLVVLQYTRHQTVFQLDYSGQNTEFDQMPGLTLCFAQRYTQALLQAAGVRHGWPLPSTDSILPWTYRDTMVALNAQIADLSTEAWQTGDPFRPQLRRPEQPRQKVKKGRGAVFHRLPRGQLSWHAKEAKTPIYRLFHNFSVIFKLQASQNPDDYRLSVTEQVRMK